MKRLLMIAIVLGAAAFAFISLRDTPSVITVTDAKATAVQGSNTTYMVGLTIQNDGGPDALLAVSSVSDAKVSLMNPAMMDAALVIPGESSAILAMDGAHMMLMGADLEAGAFVPVTLSFKNAGTVATRIQIASGMPMMHDMSGGVSDALAPRLQIAPVGNVSADGFEIALETENFAFESVADDAAHVAGKGHAHVYLNGLKLGRIYEESVKIGALSAGKYTLTISLNTHDHRPYLRNGQPVSAVFDFEIP